MEFDWSLLLLTAVGFIAGFINTVAGGGSLLTLPTLIFLGLDPAVANGTNRIGIFLQTTTGALGYASKGVKTFPFSIWCGISALIGAIIGAQIAVDIKGDLFNRILAIVMVVVILLVAFQPKIKASDIKERIKGKYFIISIIVFFFLGIYGGFINAGIGFILLMFLAYFNKMPLVKANATKVTIAAIYTFAALLLFIYNGKVSWTHGVLLAIGNMFGAWLSSRLAVKKGDGYVRIFLIVMVGIMAIKLWFF